MKILVIEDDAQLSKGIATALRGESYVVDCMAEGLSGLHCLEQESYDTVVLDLGLPDIDGVEVLRRMRNAKIDVPVLILTARDGIEDRVSGLDAGADDYLIKPFDLHELMARIRVLLRRRSGRAQSVIRYGDIALFPESQRVEFKGEPITLPRREFMLLHELLSNVGRVLTRQQLEQSIYDWADEVGSNAIEVHIHHLRKKFNNDLVKTIRGVGYIVEKHA